MHNNFSAGLYVVSTPIGNASDITLRALDVLRQADTIVCEDTRVTSKLLAIHSITSRLMAYHEFNAEKVRPKILKLLNANEVVALVSDAGTPLISDPGYKLVKSCIQENIPIMSVPGACSPIAALTISGLPTDKFFFAGFPPNKSQARLTFFEQFSNIPATTIFFESAQRLKYSLQALLEVFGDREAAVAREITKKFEEVKRGKISSLIELYEEYGTPKGEIIILVEPVANGQTTVEDLDELIQLVLEKKSVRDTVHLLTKATGLPHKEIYAQALALKNQ